MPESLSYVEQLLRDRAEVFGRDVLLPLERELASGADRRTLRARVVAASKAAGLFGMTQPAAFGGTEAGPLALTIVRDGLASACLASLAGAVFGPSPGVLAGSTEPLRGRYLGPLLAGEKRGAFAFTEPDDAPFHTCAERRGETLVVRGRKSYVTGGADADFLNVLAEVEGEGRAMLVIDRDAPGVVIEKRFESLDGSHHAAFRFDDVVIDAGLTIGRAGDGMSRAMRQIGDTRLAIAATAVGRMRYTLDFLTTHLAAPHRSGDRLGDREGVRLRFAELRINTFAARSMVYRTARLAERAENVVNEGIACKVFTTETLGEVVDGAIQLVGGAALTVGHPLERLYREVRVLRIAEGANDVLRLNLARGRLELALGKL